MFSPKSSLLSKAPTPTPFLQFHLPKPISFHTSKFHLPPKLVCRKTFSGANRSWRPNTMREVMGTGVSSVGSSGDEFTRGGSAFEQEAFIDGSSGLPPNYHLSGRLHFIMNRLSKWVVTAVFGGVVLVRHDPAALWIAMGSVLNVILCNTLKQILKHDRPASAMSSGHGMPSSHAQSIFFAAVVVVVSMAEWHGMNTATTILSGLVLAIGSYFSWLRVSLHYHTLSQVGVGAVLGSLFSLLWFWAWNAFVMKAFISFLWIRIIVILGAAGLIVGFVLHVLQHWITDET